jgi:prepilin-type N-terminal cleavage/methylation domain-containing protein|tara:strand:+ start:384 stop:875 length:492 start_codon:yes stop_codon:yes gene_type:complete
MKTNAPKHGFTIVELMLSLGILAILAALAAPMFGNDDALQLDVAKRLLVSDLEYAQILAIANPEEEIALFVDPNGRGWGIATIDEPDTPLSDPITGEILVTQLGYGSAAPSTDVTIQCNTTGNMVAFDPNGGLVDFTQTAELLLQSSEMTTIVAINPTTGSIQ